MSSRVVERARNALRARRKDPALVAMAESMHGAIALEPGGPSAVFEARGAFPAYPQLGALDTLDYSERTLWSDDSWSGPQVRRRLIGEARRLEDTEADSYDAVLASHVLEHLADPLGTLAEWQRVIRPGGHLLLVMPHREGTFDHRRPVTTLEHMRTDAERETGEDDMSHLPEILELHDLDRDPGAPNREVFEQRCRDNLSSRGMHHHVFDTRSVAEMCWAGGLEIVAIHPARPFNIFCLCQVDGNTPGVDRAGLATVLAGSPFKSDRATPHS